MIRIHNSLTGEKQKLEPVSPGHVRMYSCGVTVYDYFHVGNARMLVVFDMVSRYLRHRGFRVTYVRNITDVDDKIINRAIETGVDWRAHAAKFTAAMHEDLDKLGCLRPEKEPKASEFIGEMLTMIGQLITNGYAYQASNGDVMYDVHKFAAYGKLSGKKLEDLRAGSRVEVDAAKRDPLDFVLWKSAKPGEPAWPSPWGNGRPG
ncbi:MAG TPA: cysteine--tRNA ligase, partial [Steroidobacteraceae bacterium]|nr:cysteine--tRNA ligase [Steroidobacteraceae bacterium]